MDKPVCTVRTCKLSPAFIALCTPARLAPRCPCKMLEESGVLASAFFFDRNSKLIDTLVDNEVKRISRHIAMPEADQAVFLLSCCAGRHLHTFEPLQLIRLPPLHPLNIHHNRLTCTLLFNIPGQKGHALYTIPGYSVDETHDIFAQLMDVLCTPARIGTNYEGSSTNDPIFWVLHPTIDRYVSVCVA